MDQEWLPGALETQNPYRSGISALISFIPCSKNGALPPVNPPPDNGNLYREVNLHWQAIEIPARNRVGGTIKASEKLGSLGRREATTGDVMKVIILCGGKGTRSYPFTHLYPKPMMPVCGTPILVHIMQLYSSQGFNDFVLAAGHRIEVLIDYFDNRFPDWNVKVLDTGPESDTGERILRCQAEVGDTFFATYGDGLGDVDLVKLLEFHRRARGFATVTTVPMPSQYGTIHFDDNSRVSQFREKPILRDHWVNAGFFVFNKGVFQHWKGNNLETEVLPHLVSLGHVFAYQHQGFWKSMDTSKDQEELESACLHGQLPWNPSIEKPKALQRVWQTAQVR